MKPYSLCSSCRRNYRAQHIYRQSSGFCMFGLPHRKATPQQAQFPAADHSVSAALHPRAAHPQPFSTYIGICPCRCITYSPTYAVHLVVLISVKASVGNSGYCVRCYNVPCQFADGFVCRVFPSSPSEKYVGLHFLVKVESCEAFPRGKLWRGCGPWASLASLAGA